MISFLIVLPVFAVLVAASVSRERHRPDYRRIALLEEWHRLMDKKDGVDG
jgi:hypothetical protein